MTYQFLARLCARVQQFQNRRNRNYDEMNRDQLIQRIMELNDEIELEMHITGILMFIFKNLSIVFNIGLFFQ